MARIGGFSLSCSRMVKHWSNTGQTLVGIERRVPSLPDIGSPPCDVTGPGRAGPGQAMEAEVGAGWGEAKLEELVQVIQSINSYPVN